MIVSREDAVGLLSKWATESTPVWVVAFAAGAAVISFIGSITDLRSDGFVIAHQGGHGDAVFRLDGLVGFDYQDIREADQFVQEKLGKKVVSSLHMWAESSNYYISEMVTPMQGSSI